MAVNGPEPTPSAAALAAERNLGEWAQATFLPRKALFSKRWEAARLCFFRRGVVVTGPDDFHAAYDWQSGRVVQNLTTVNGGIGDARYILFDASGHGVAIGRGNDHLFGRQRERLGITSLTMGAPFVHEGTWGPFVQRSIVEAQLPGALDRVQRGAMLDFGAVSVDRSGVMVKDRVAGWGDLEQPSMGNGLISFRTTGRSGPRLPPVPAHETVNLGLFFAVCRHLGSVSR